MFGLGLMVEMSKKLHIVFKPDLSCSSGNMRQSLGLSNVCCLVAAICVLAGDREYLEHSVPQPHPQALPASSAGAGLAGRGTVTQTQAFTSVVLQK